MKKLQQPRETFEDFCDRQTDRIAARLSRPTRRRQEIQLLRAIRQADALVAPPATLDCEIRYGAGVKTYKPAR